MKVDIECHGCQKEFEAEWDVRGKCPYCANKYDWVWEGGLWSEEETCIPIFESESEAVKKSFLISRDWI